MTSFTEWLATQTRRGDPIGDLAGDVGTDPEFPTNGDLSDYQDYLPPDIHGLLAEAWDEYEEAGP